MKNPAIAVDNLDTRKEVHYLIGKLSPLDRIRFLHWCCQQSELVRGKRDFKPAVDAKTIALAKAAHAGDTGADERLALEAYIDLWYLTMQYHLPIDWALRKLEEFGKKKRH